MKVEYEKIQPDEGSSFRVIHSHSQGDRFFWHYHPEYEIVYVHQGSGRRHVGNHLANYEEGELVFIGPNLPHSGFGYGVEGEHEEIVVQLREDFLGENFLKSPEMKAVQKLFDRSRQGVYFFGETRQVVANRLQKLPKLSNFQRLIEVLEIFQILATTDEFSLLNVVGSRFDFSHKEEERINKIYQYVENNFMQPIDIQAVANLASLTVPSFCRYFKKMTHLTFTDFVNEFRINQACKLLLNDNNIANICYEIGFNNVSHFNKVFKEITGKNPSEYRRKMI
jgi:AraC-like DNA-binding protein/quercetin dioxygenase-like cupin family protein